MRRKLQIRTLLILGIAFLLAMGGTVAYFVTSETAHNLVSMGGVKIALNELDGPTGSKPFHDLENIIAGETYSKIPYVENIDLEPVWIRAKVSLKKTAGDGTESDITDFSSLMTLQEIGENWTASSDNFYYYNLAVNNSEQTEPIFRSVKFADTIDDEYQLATYTLTVTAEATQAKNNGLGGLDANPYATTTVSFEGGAENFVFSPTGNLFGDLSQFMPGDTRSSTITVKNIATDYDFVKIYLRAEPDSGASNLLSKLNLTVSQDSELLSSAPASNPSVLATNYELGTFNPGKETNLSIELSAPSSLGNAYEYTSGDIKWIFTAEAYKDGQIVPPNTGAATKDKASVNTEIVTAVALATVLSMILALIILSRKKSKNEK